MTARRKAAPPAPEPPILTENYNHVLDSMGLRVMVFGNYTTPDHSRSPQGATFWHPEIITGAKGELIVWRKAGDPHNNYAFDGYVPQIGPHMCGGTHRTLAQALGWIRLTRMKQFTS